MSYRCTQCARMVPLDDIEVWHGRVYGTDVICVACVQAMIDAVPPATTEEQIQSLRENGVIE